MKRLCDPRVGQCLAELRFRHDAALRRVFAAVCAVLVRLLLAAAAAAPSGGRVCGRLLGRRRTSGDVAVMAAGVCRGTGCESLDGRRRCGRVLHVRAVLHRRRRRQPAGQLPAGCAGAAAGPSAAADFGVAAACRCCTPGQPAVGGCAAASMPFLLRVASVLTVDAARRGLESGRAIEAAEARLPCRAPRMARCACAGGC